MTLPIPSSFSGQAQATTLTAGIDDSELSFQVGSVSTWLQTVGDDTGQPLGYGGKPFVLTLDYGTASEEKVLCSNISGTTITVVEGGRGYDSVTPTTATSHNAGATVVHTISTTVPHQANLGVTNAAAASAAAAVADGKAVAAQTTANTAQTTALGLQLAGTVGKLTGAVPGTPTQLRTVGWTTSVSALNGGAQLAIPTDGSGAGIAGGFTHTLLAISATYANEQSVPGGYRAVIDTNGGATNSFKVWVYNAAGTKVTSGSFTFSFMAIGY
jgi:hypothetical protein